MDNTKLKSPMSGKIQTLQEPEETTAAADLSLAPVDTNYIALSNNALEIIKENLKNQPISFDLFDIVKSPSGGSTVFSVPGLRQNYSLVQAAHLDKDDVYQSLAMRLIRAVELYKPGARSLEGYIFSQLRYELLNCKSAKRRYGFSGAPYDLRNAVVSLEALEEADPYWELRMMEENVLCAS